MSLFIHLLLSLFLLGRSVGLRLNGEGGITPFQLRLKLGALSPEWVGIHFMYILDKSKSFDALKHLISIPSMTYFQKAFYKSCEMLTRKGFDELVASDDPDEIMERLQVIGIDCLSRVSQLKDIESWDLPIRRALPQDHRFDRKQLYEIFVHASTNRGLLSSSFLCGAVRLEQLGFWAPFMIDGPCVVSNPALVKMLVASLELEQTWLMDNQSPPNFPKLIGQLIHIGAVMAFASGRMTEQRDTVQFLFIRKQIKDTLNNMARYETMLSEEERPLFNLIFKMVHTVTASTQEYHAEQLERSLKIAGMTNFIQVYPRICEMIDGLKAARPTMWASQLEIETLIVIARMQPPKALEFPLSVLNLLKRAKEVSIVLPVRHLVVLLWAIRLENGQIFTICHEILIHYILKHMTPNSDMEMFKQLDLAKMLPFSWKRKINRNLNSWWESTGELPFNKMTELLMSLHGLAVQIPDLPEVQRCSVEQLDQLRCLVKYQIDYVFENYMVPAGSKVLASRDWPVYVPVVRTPSFITGWLWLLLYVAHVLSISLPFHLHPLCLQMLQGSNTEMAARFFVSLSLNTEYNGCPPEKQPSLLRQTMQFHKHLQVTTADPSEIVMSTTESFIKFKGFLERWDEGEPVPPFSELETLIQRDAEMVLKFMTPMVDIGDEFESFLEPAEILAILLSHPSV